MQSVLASANTNLNLVNPINVTRLAYERHRLCCAPFGGPIAAMRDDSKMVVVAAGASTRPVVRLFSAAGAELGSFLWERGPIAGWGWSDQQVGVWLEPDGVGLPGVCVQ